MATQQAGSRCGGWQRRQRGQGQNGQPDELSNLPKAASSSLDGKFHLNAPIYIPEWVSRHPGLRVSIQLVSSSGLHAEEATAHGSPLTPAAVKLGLRGLAK